MPLVCVGFVLTERICTGRRLSWATARLVCFFSFCIEIFIQFTGKKILLLRSHYGQQDMICLATNVGVKKKIHLFYRLHMCSLDVYFIDLFNTV